VQKLKSLLLYRRIGLAVILLTLSVIAVCEAAEADGENVSVFDNVWSYAILYEDEDNRFIQKFALSGRLQPDSAWFDADEGHFNDELWRRFRFGFKSDVFRNWVVHLEGDFDLNNKPGEMYTRLTDAYIGWSPTDNLTIKAFKQSAGFTLDGATSSKKLLTMQRNNLTNNLWFTSEYFTGLLAKGEMGQNWSYKAGVFSSDGSDELSHFEASYFTLASLSYHFSDSAKLDKGLIRVDYVYNDEDVNADTRDFSQVLSLVTQWEIAPWGVWTDISAGKGYAGQSDVWGVVLMPFYNFTKHIQSVLRYTYLKSKNDNGLRLGRYEREIVEGRGNEYNEIYGGINIYFYGQKFKWQTGLQYTTMEDDADDEGKYEGWGLSTGLRLYW
jgi:phosphate-selective porin OprO/OprP